MKFNLSHSSAREAEDDVSNFKQATNHTTTKQSSVEDTHDDILAYPFDKVASITQAVLTGPVDISHARITVIGKDLPRLMHRMTLNGVYLERNNSVPLKLNLDTILQRIDNVVTPFQTSSDHHSSIRQLITEKFANSDSDFLKHQEITSQLLNVFELSHPVITILRSGNQNSIAQSLVFLKKMFYEKAQLEFKDQQWRISVDSSNELVDTTATEKRQLMKQKVTVVHHRKERIDASKGLDLVTWFLFNYDVIFTFEREIIPDDESSEHVPLNLQSYFIEFKGVEQYDPSIVSDDVRINTELNASSFIAQLFHKYIHFIHY